MDYKEAWERLKEGVIQAETMMDELPSAMFPPEYITGAKVSYQSVVILMNKIEKNDD